MNASLSQKRAQEEGDGHCGVTPTLTTCPANLPRRSARTVVIAEALSEGRIREWFFADAVTRRILQALPVQIDDIALEPSVVGQHLPRQRMVAFAKPEEAPERHNSIGDLAGVFVDHEVIDVPELLSVALINRRAFHLIRGDQAFGFVDGYAFARGV